MPGYVHSFAPFTPGPLTIEQAAELNRLARETVRILNLNVDAPLSLIPNAGSYSLLCDVPEQPHLIVRVATATALAANTRTGDTIEADANGALTVDGISVSEGDDILVKDEPTPSKNGPFRVINPGGVSAKFNLRRSSVPLQSGMLHPVCEGTLNACQTYKLSTADPITPNTTSLTYITPGVGSLTQVPVEYSLTGHVATVPAPASGLLYVTPTATNWQMRGMTGGWSGRQVTIVNVGPYPFRLPHAYTGGGTDDWYIHPAWTSGSDRRLEPGESGTFLWDTSGSYWKMRAPLDLGPGKVAYIGGGSFAGGAGELVYIDGFNTTYNLPTIQQAFGESTNMSTTPPGMPAVGVVVDNGGGAGKIIIVRNSGRRWDGTNGIKYAGTTPAVGDALYLRPRGAGGETGMVQVGKPSPSGNAADGVTPVLYGTQFIGTCCVAGTGTQCGIDLAIGDVEDRRGAKVSSSVGLREAQDYAFTSGDYQG